MWNLQTIGEVFFSLFLKLIFIFKLGAFILGILKSIDLVIDIQTAYKHSHSGDASKRYKIYRFLYTKLKLPLSFFRLPVVFLLLIVFSQAEVGPTTFSYFLSYMALILFNIALIHRVMDLWTMLKVDLYFTSLDPNFGEILKKPESVRPKTENYQPPKLIKNLTIIVIILFIAEILTFSSVYSLLWENKGVEIFYFDTNRVCIDNIKNNFLHRIIYSVYYSSAVTMTAECSHIIPKEKSLSLLILQRLDTFILLSVLLGTGLSIISNFGFFKTKKKVK
ncbi:MAG: hypothetical protein J7L26_04490 [Candidatus Aminicenantes bacterium]|nr:hypothetical protein [Candidatus Aminicenantes bacterium]